MVFGKIIWCISFYVLRIFNWSPEILRDFWNSINTNSRVFLRIELYKLTINFETYTVSQINCFPCSYPVVTLVPRHIENQLISAINIKSSYGITIHVIIKNETSCRAISRNWHLKFCVVTLLPRYRRLYIHVETCKNIMMIIMILILVMVEIWKCKLSIKQFPLLAQKTLLKEKKKRKTLSILVPFKLLPSTPIEVKVQSW